MDREGTPPRREWPERRRRVIGEDHLVAGSIRARVQGRGAGVDRDHVLGAEVFQGLLELKDRGAQAEPADSISFHSRISSGRLGREIGIMTVSFIKIWRYLLGSRAAKTIAARQGVQRTAGARPDPEAKNARMVGRFTCASGILSDGQLRSRSRSHQRSSRRSARRPYPHVSRPR